MLLLSLFFFFSPLVLYYSLHNKTAAALTAAGVLCLDVQIALSFASYL